VAVRSEGALARGAHFVLDLRPARRIHRPLVDRLAPEDEEDRDDADQSG
jgi:hypothetical protein